jgi:DNA-binding CsgD family transcriptional regulator
MRFGGRDSPRALSTICMSWTRPRRGVSLGMLVRRAPRALRFVFAARHDLRPRLGLTSCGSRTNLRIFAPLISASPLTRRTLLDSGGVRARDLVPAPCGACGAVPPPPRPAFEADPLTDGEIRVLRYLPTHLTAPEIARQLFLSVHTVTTHMRHIYAKLGVHRRHEAVDRARALGLLALIPLRVLPDHQS